MTAPRKNDLSNEDVFDTHGKPGTRPRDPADDRAYSREARELLIALLEKQAAHVEDNANALRRFEGSEDEARCRVLASAFLWDLAHSIRLGFELDEIDKIIAAANARAESDQRLHHAANEVSDTLAAAAAQAPGCKHDWPGPGEKPAKWMCACGTLVYRSYADYCDD